MTDELELRELKKTDPIPYDLLLTADPDRRNIDKYIFGPGVYAVYKQEEIIGCYVLCKADAETIEIKNIAIRTDHQNKGLGTALLNHALLQATSGGFRKITIGTGNSSIGQLYLYQKVGFRITGVLRDFFRENYEAPIIENGIECRDMIV